MNLRVIKKDIEYFIGEFIDDCALFTALNPHKDSEELAKITDEAIDPYNSLKDKINDAPAEGSKKAYYNGIRKEMFEKLDELCEKLSTVVASGK